jgi:GGDEF domain-containing protein
LLWTTAGVVIGEIRARHVRERTQLESDLAEASQRVAQVEKAYDHLDAVKANLESRIAGQFRTGINIYRAARTLDRSDPAEVLMGVIEIVNAVMGPQKFSLYLLAEGALAISLDHGWDPSDAFSRTFRSNSTLFQEVIAGRRVLCAANPEDEKVLAGQGVLAGPLVDDETGDIAGMLKIEQLNFLDLHFSNVQTFKALCEWIAHSYFNAVHTQAAQAEALINTKTRVMTHTFFERQRDFLVKLGRRVGFEISMIVIRLENADEIGDVRASAVAVVLSSVSQELLRSTDLLFEQKAGSHQYCIMLPNTPAENAHMVGEKLKQRLLEETKGSLKDARFSVTVQSVYRAQEENASQPLL